MVSQKGSESVVSQKGSESVVSQKESEKRASERKKGREMEEEIGRVRGGGVRGRRGEKWRKRLEE